MNKIITNFTTYIMSNVNEAKSFDRDVIVSMIENDEWETPSGKSFKTALEKSKHKEMLTIYDASELDKMKLFKLKGYDIGYALKMKAGKYQEIVAVFNNEPKVKGIGTILMQSAIKNGGVFLDHFDSKQLTTLYTKLGFKEIGRDAYDSQYDKSGAFKNKYGELDVIYRKLK